VWDLNVIQVVILVSTILSQCGETCQWLVNCTLPLSTSKTQLRWSWQLVTRLLAVLPFLLRLEEEVMLLWRSQDKEIIAEGMKILLLNWWNFNHQLC